MGHARAAIVTAWYFGLKWDYPTAFESSSRIPNRFGNLASVVRCLKEQTTQALASFNITLLKGKNPAFTEQGGDLAFKSLWSKKTVFRPYLHTRTNWAPTISMRYLLPPPRPSLFSRGHRALHETSIPAAPLLGSMGHLNSQSWFRKGHWIQPKSPQLSRLSNALRAECLMTV